MVLDAATVLLDLIIQIFKMTAERLFGPLQDRLHSVVHYATSSTPCIFASSAGTSSAVNEKPK